MFVYGALYGLIQMPISAATDTSARKLLTRSGVARNLLDAPEGRRRTGIEMAPDRSAEAEHVNSDKHAGVGEDQPLRQQPGQQRAGADAARQREQAGADPGRVGAFGGEDGAVGGEPRRAVGAVLDAVGGVLELLGAIGDLRLCCSTTLAECLTASAGLVSAGLGLVAVWAMRPTTPAANGFSRVGASPASGNAPNRRWRCPAPVRKAR